MTKKRIHQTARDVTPAGSRSPVVILAVLAGGLILAACDPNGTPFDSPVAAGSVRVQGAFDNLVPGESIIEARAAALGPGPLSPRSLISQSASISVILSDAALEDDGAVTTTEVQPEGGFSVDVDTSLADEESSGDYVMLAYDETLGVGVEQLIGFIEVPAGADASSAGWPLGGTAQGTTVDLGTMDGDGGDDRTIVANSDQNTLYDLLGADQSEVLFQAERDNFLKVLANEYLNRGAALGISVGYQVHGPAAEQLNTWADPGELRSELDEYFVIGFEPTEEVTDQSLDALIGTGTSLELTPPGPVRTMNGSVQFGPSSPIQRSDVVEPDDDNAYVMLQAPIPAGDWTLELSGDLDRVDDLERFSITDSGGNFSYFYPIIRINTDGATGEVVSFELRWYYWDNQVGSYILAENVVDELPLFGSWEFSYEIDDDTIDLPIVPGTPIGPVADLYWENPPAGADELLFVEMRLDLGGARLNYMYFK